MNLDTPDPPKIDVQVTYLEMRTAPTAPPPTPPGPHVRVVHARRPTVSFYRYLYNTVGGPWLWVDRRKLSDDQLAGIVQHERVEVHVLEVDGTPAGYAELDRRRQAEEGIELAYFGLIPEFVGQGLGKFLLSWAIHRAWTHAPPRFWLHTCTLDHPRALGVYQRAGLAVYKREVETVSDPRASGWFET